jgi:pimeloyl-ACP methyl ester carboxylesterase
MKQFRRGNLVFDVVDGGPRDGVPVVLHGFPETSDSWAEVTPALQEGGYRTLAFDQRGYSLEAMPSGRSAYRLEELAGDVLALAEQADLEPFHVVGQDWGASVAWALAAWHPRRLRTVSALSVPHPRAFVTAMLTGSQFLVSWYMGAFQVPGVPERLLRDGDRLRARLVKTGLPERFADLYLAKLARRGALTGALNWYRGAQPMRFLRMPPVAVPALYLWGTRDAGVMKAAAQGNARHVRGPYRFEALSGVTHWIPETVPETVAGFLVEHLHGK